mgnify:CR=1 FL=1
MPIYDEIWDEEGILIVYHLRLYVQTLTQFKNITKKSFEDAEHIKI